MIVSKLRGKTRMVSGENALIRFALLGAKKRHHMPVLEWSLVANALVA